MAHVANIDYETLCRADKRTLERLLCEGSAPSLESIAGWEFRGYNVVPITELIRSRKFKKAFRWDSDNPSRLMGYNAVVAQNGIGGPWIDKTLFGKPMRHSFYDVYPVRPHSQDNRYPHSLMLDYGTGQNSILNPSGLLRDYLVQVSPDNEDLLLGKAYGALGPIRLHLGWFVLERLNRVQ